MCCMPILQFKNFCCCLYFVYNYAQNLLVYLVFGIVKYQRVKYLGIQAKIAHNLFCLYLKVVVPLSLALNPSN